MKAAAEVKVFEEVYRGYSDDVFRFLLFLSGDRALAQDLASETFVRAWTASVPVVTATAKAYLFVIARNLFLSNRRGRRVTVEPPLTLAAEDNHAADYEHQAELAVTLEDLKTVAEGDRAALLMTVFEGLSHEEAGRALGISIGAVKARVFRARLRLIDLREQRTAGRKP